MEKRLSRSASVGLRGVFAAQASKNLRNPVACVDSDFVLAFLFLETVDRMIGTVPILGQWVLGDDKSLVTLYLKADGPWENPNMRPLAPGVVESAAGWAVKVVASGANQVRKILGVGPPDPLPELNESDSPR